MQSLLVITIFTLCLWTAKTVSILNCLSLESNFNMYTSLFRTQEEQDQFQKQYVSQRNRKKLEAEDTISRKQQQCVNRCLVNPRRWFSDEEVHGSLEAGSEEITDNQQTDILPISRRTSGASLNSVMSHGCCVSWPNFTQPTAGVTINGQNVTVVQTLARKQYFPTETCVTETNCTRCRCRCEQQVAYMTAVVVNDLATSCRDYFVIDYIKVPGSCKCMNI